MVDALLATFLKTQSFDTTYGVTSLGPFPNGQ